MYLKDDPTRVADYGYFKSERKEVVEVSEKEAFENILEALKYKEAVYGLTPPELEELLIDAILKDEETVLEVLSKCGGVSEVLDTSKKIAEDFYDGANY